VVVIFGMKRSCFSVKMMISGVETIEQYSNRKYLDSRHAP